MKISEILTPSFKALGKRLGLRIELFNNRLVATEPMWRKALSMNSDFCRAVVNNGYLNVRQMKRAARRYRLGATRSGGVIFWQIDSNEQLHDGKVMYYRADCHRDKERHPSWVGALLTRRYGWADAGSMTSRHCLFGLHLLRERRADRERAIAVVESEKTAIIMSELLPDYIWLATGGMGNVQAEKFRQLRGMRVVMFPDTDTNGKTFAAWYEAAQRVMRQPFWEHSPPVTVSALLEQRATPNQKERKIDLVEYMFEASKRPV